LIVPAGNTVSLVIAPLRKPFAKHSRATTPHPSSSAVRISGRASRLKGLSTTWIASIRLCRIHSADMSQISEYFETEFPI